MTNPALFIVAGPNGAGKSLFSKELTTTDFEVFDGDKHMSALVKKYPETGKVFMRTKEYPAWVKPVVAQFQDYIFCTTNMMRQQRYFFFHFFPF